MKPISKPIDVRSPRAAARAYTGVLGWPVAAGHGVRPGRGCTCPRAGCRMPGAHPRARPLPVAVDTGAVEELDEVPGAALIAPTLHFDAVVVPREVGMSAMIGLDRVAPVPCLVDAAHAYLLLRPGTGCFAVPEPDPQTQGQVQAGVRVRTGPTGWVALPPSHGVRWDTVPWDTAGRRPVPLPHGGDVRRHLAWACTVLARAGQARP